jgi:hypothetical protein
MRSHLRLVHIARATRQRKAGRAAMKQQWRQRQAQSLATAQHHLAELVGKPEDFATHADYMAAVNRAIAAKRASELEVAS